MTARGVMSKIGIIAGSGSMPLEFIKAAKKRDETVVVFALKDMASPELEQAGDKIYWMELGQIAKFGFLFMKERIRHVALLGKVEKKLIYENNDQDSTYKDGLKKLSNKKDYSILNAITNGLAKVGVEVIDTSKYLCDLYPGEGVLTNTPSDEDLDKNVGFGTPIARKLADMDIGQTIIVKNEAVVAVESMECTDATIDRAGELAGDGCVMIKMSRPDQDMRWDVPAVGPETMKKLIDNKFRALVLDSGKLYLIEQERLLAMADEAGITVIGV